MPHGALMLHEAFDIRVPGRVTEYNPLPFQGYNPGPGTDARFKITPYGVGWEAQLLVGLSVDGVPTWQPEQIRDYVIQARREQLQGLVADERAMYPIEHGGSVKAQLGYWERIDYLGHGSKEPGENSVSVEVINMPGEAAKDFKDNMMRLAALLAETFQQYTVVLKLAKGGMVKEIMGVDFER